MKKFFCTALILAVAVLSAAAQQPMQPSSTYLYAQRDTCDLYLDVYNPARVEAADSLSRPTIIFAFGGGFKEGRRDSPHDVAWFSRLASDGFRVISIDYRLGLNGARNIGVAQWKTVYNAVQIATEDLFSATSFIIENADELGVDPSNLVISGSSAGAITAMQAEWELCNRTALASALPEDFRYAGVMAFAGAVFSTEGPVKYDRAPDPTLMIHGTVDKIVDYREISFFSIHFSGAGVLSREFAKKSDCYRVLRYKDHGHEMASAEMQCYDEEMLFLEQNVMRKKNIVVDATITDPTIPVPDWAKGKTGKDLYK